MSRWLRTHDRAGRADAFDPVRAGQAYGLDAEAAVQLWDDVRGASCSADGRVDEEMAEQQFRAVAARRHARDSRPPGRTTLVETHRRRHAPVEDIREAGKATLVETHHGAPAEELDPEAGKTTLVLVESPSRMPGPAGSRDGATTAEAPARARSSAASGALVQYATAGASLIPGATAGASLIPRATAGASLIARATAGASLIARAAADAAVQRARAGTAAVVQRKADGADARLEDPVRVASAGVAGASTRLPYGERIQRLFGRHSLADVRVQIGGAGELAARALGAVAYASGERIAFAATPDLHTAAHEAAHIVQQRAGLTLAGGVGAAGDLYEQHADAVAAQVVAGQTAEPLLDQLASHSAASAPVVQRKEAGEGRVPGISAAAYVEQTRPMVLAAIAERIAHVELVSPHARLLWTTREAAAAALAAAIRAYVEAVPGLALRQLMMLSFPLDLGRVVDEARNGRDGAGWMPEVGRAVGEALDVPLVTSIERMGLRLRVQLDGNAQGGMPRGSSLIASCPLDGVIADVLVAPGLVTSRAPSGTPNDTPGRPFARGAREVEYTWLGRRDPALWNWILVSSPRDATAEHVARTPLAGGEVMAGSEQAYRIAASPPYFGIPIETARRVPEAWAYAPPHVKTAAKVGDPGPRVADGSVLANSVLADDAALAQARPATKADRSIRHALERARVQLAFLKHKLTPWRAHLTLGVAEAFVLRRGVELKRDPRGAERWAPVVAAAERTIYAVASEVGAQLNQMEKHGARPRDAHALGPFVAILQAYARAAGVAHLGAEAPVALAQARRLREMLPIELAQDRIRIARGAVAGQQSAQRTAGRVEPRSGESIAAIPGLATRAADLRLDAAKGGPIDHDTADELAADADETALRAQIVTLQTQLATVEHRANEVNLRIANPAGWTIQRTTAHLRNEARGWLAQLDRTKDVHRRFGASRARGAKRAEIDGARRTLGAVRNQMVHVQLRTELDEFLRYAYERISDKQLRDAVASMALQVGIMIATGEVGVAAVRGLALAREVAMVGELATEVRQVGVAYQALEVVAQSFLATQAQGTTGGPSGARAFVDNALGMVLTTAALRPFEALFGDAAALERELRSWRGVARAGVKAAVKAPLEVGVGIAAAGAAHTATHGTAPAAVDADELATQGIALVASKFVHRHAIQLRERITRAASGADRADTAALLRLIEALELRAAAAGDRPPVATVRALLADHAVLLARETRLYDRSTAAPAQHARAQSLADHAALGGSFIKVSFRLAGLTPVVDGAVYEGTATQISHALADAGRSGAPFTHTIDPDTGAHRVVSGDHSYELRALGDAPPKRAPLDPVDVVIASASPEDRARVERFLAPDVARGRRLIHEYGNELIEHLQTNPRTDPREVETALSKARQQVRQRVPGLYEGSDTSKPPDG